MEKPMKILFYLDRRSRGGAQRVMTSLANRFAGNQISADMLQSRKTAEKYDVILACQFPAPDKAYPISPDVREVIMPPASSNRLKRQSDRIRHLTELCEKERPDIIISFLIGTNIIAIKTGKKLGIPVLISVRNDPARDGSRFSRALIKRYYPKASGCVFQTKDAEAYFGFKYPTRVIMNPLSENFLTGLSAANKDTIDTSFAPKSTDAASTALTRLISVGRLEVQKRHDITLRAFSALKKSHPDITLTVFGQGPLESELKQLSKELGIEDAVIFAGITDDIAGELVNSDIFIMSSDYEGMPNALMEAMAAGICCISTDCPCGGPAMLIDDTTNGYLCKPNDIKDLADKLEYVLTHPDDARSAGQKASEITEKCRIDEIARQWRQMIDLCLTKKP